MNKILMKIMLLMAGFAVVFTGISFLPDNSVQAAEKTHI